MSGSEPLLVAGSEHVASGHTAQARHGNRTTGCMESSVQEIGGSFGQGPDQLAILADFG